MPIHPNHSTNSSKLLDTFKATTVLSLQHVVRLGIEDLEDCQKLINNEHARKLFGKINLENALHKAWLVLGVVDDDNSVSGLAVFRNYPNIPAIAPWAWDEWVINMYDLVQVHNRNTLWLNLVLWDYRYYFFFLKPIIQYVFKFNHTLHYVIMVIPPTNCRTDFLKDLGIPIKPKSMPNIKKTQMLYMMSRENFMQQFTIRGAVEEDNYSIVQLIQKYTPKLQEMYGNYYIAEMLTKFRDCGRKVIVAEDPRTGKVIGALCVNKELNFKFIQEEFNLVPFNGLKRCSSHDNITTTRESELFNAETTQEAEEISDIPKASSTSKSFAHLGDEEVLIKVSDSDQFSLVFTSASLFVFLTSDDVEVEDEVDSKPPAEEFYSIYEKESKIIELEEWFSTGNIDSKVGSEDPFMFYGESNAFVLEIAVVQPSYETAYLKLFEAIFQTFPDREYCVFLKPSSHHISVVHKYFQKVSPKATSSCCYELYLLHRSSMYGIIDVQFATKFHIPQIRSLLSTIPSSWTALEQMESCIADPDNATICTVILCDDIVVGVAKVAEEYDINYLRKAYDIYPVNFKYYKSGSHGLIQYLFISPIFHKQANYFLGQIHRLCQYDALYYKIKPLTGTEYKMLNNLLEFMIPLLPIKQPEYDIEMLVKDGYLEKKIPNDEREAFALYVSTMPYLTLTSVRIDKKIVVIGCSHTSISFLTSLLFGNSDYPVIFNNVTLVCSEGFETNFIGEKLREAFLVKKYFMDVKHLNMLNFYSYLNIVNGKLGKIDRKEQIIVLDSNRFLAYDLLFLMSGEKFELPSKTPTSTFLKPENVFVINNALNANSTIMKLRMLYDKVNTKHPKIIVYGHFLQAYCTMNGLITYGIPSEHIVFIEPFPYSMTIEKKHRHNISVFNNPEIDQAVYSMILNKNIEIHSSYYFIDWDYDQTENLITAARFESRHQMLKMECLAMFYFGEKEISPRIYRVLNNAGLVYDGRLVINSKFQTNDPKIYSAGTLTKYSRKYYAPFMTHKNFSRVEIGKKLGEQIRDMLLSEEFRRTDTKKGWLFHLSRGADLVPRYEKPIMRYCKLPGGYNYFSVTKPGQRVPLSIELEWNGYVLTTGNLRDFSQLNQQGYFRLYLNNDRRVETITCISKAPIETYNLFCLWGKHESLLNNLFSRYELMQIEDLFSYFKQPWAYMLYHNKYNRLQNELDMLMSSTLDTKEQSLVNTLIAMFKETKWKPLAEEDIDDLEESIKKKPYEGSIKKKVLRFIKHNLDTLHPIYAHPYVINSIIRGCEYSPLFS